MCVHVCVNVSSFLYSSRNVVANDTPSKELGHKSLFQNLFPRKGDLRQFVLDWSKEADSQMRLD